MGWFPELEAMHNLLPEITHGETKGLFRMTGHIHAQLIVEFYKVIATEDSIADRMIQEELLVIIPAFRTRQEVLEIFQKGSNGVAVRQRRILLGIHDHDHVKEIPCTSSP
jgi:hypothetical protein